MAVTLPVIVLLVVLLMISATISATEAAFLAINRVRIRHLSETGNRKAQSTRRLLSQLDRVIGTLLVANNLSNVAITAIGSYICLERFGPQYGLIVATILITSILLLVCEVAPKMYAATHAEVVLFAVIKPLQGLIIILNPIASFFTWGGRCLLRLLRIPTKRRSPLVTEEEIKVMIQMGREAGVLAEQELRMLHRIFEFSDASVRAAMIPRDQISGIDITDTKPADVLDVMIEEGHSRMPVYRGTLDNVVGVLYSRDLLAVVRHGHLFALNDLIRPVTVVRGNKRVAELLTEFQDTKNQIAIVKNIKDETIGLITLEDLLEEIVGEIYEEVPPLRAIKQGK